jgi:hypothetical protein
MFRGCFTAKLRVVSQASGADMARSNPTQGKLYCELLDGHPAALLLPLSGHCREVART